MSIEQCVWIVPGDERRVLVRSLWNFGHVRDMCTCCGTTVEVDHPHLCEECCQGRGGGAAAPPPA